MNNSQLCFTADAAHHGQRADAYLADVSELSRSAAARLMEEGAVTKNGIPVGKKNGRRI